MRPPLRIPSFPTSRGDAWSQAGSVLSGLLTPTLRLGVTGLSRAGKTVFITALVRNLVTGARLPFLSADAEGRIESVSLEPQPHDAVPRFDYEAHLAALATDPPEWPESTRRISELRVTIAFRPEGRLRGLLGQSRLNIDIVDYPGEWLTDLTMLEQSYETWSAEALRSAREPRRAAAAKPWLDFVGALDPEAPGDEQDALEGARVFTAYLHAAREHEEVSTLGPGRFVMPGDLKGSPLLTFCPLETRYEGAPPRGSLAAMMARRYESYRTHVVKPFFSDHFSRLDRQIVLVDVLSALNGGPDSVADLEHALTGILAIFRPGPNAWHAMITGRRIDRLLFAATKADHLHHTSHDRLEAILRLITEQAIDRAETAGAGVRVMALAALRATHEREAQIGKELLPCILGTPMPGERVDGKIFDGREVAAVFPGDLPEDPAAALEKAAWHKTRDTAAGDTARDKAREAAFVRFRPPRVPPPGADGESPAAPHIRLDRALEFLIGDRLT